MTDKEITKKIKNSLLSDKAIEMCLMLHQHNKGMFNQFITKLEQDMELLINQGGTVYDAFVWCKENRTIRLSAKDDMIPVEKTVIRMAGEMSKYKQDIVCGDLLSQTKVVERNGIRHIFLG